jgi:hypothetical protein
MCFGTFTLHFAPNGAGYIVDMESYKHVAPLEQEPSITAGLGRSRYISLLTERDTLGTWRAINMLLLWSKNPPVLRDKNPRLPRKPVASLTQLGEPPAFDPLRQFKHRRYGQRSGKDDYPVPPG